MTSSGVGSPSSRRRARLLDALAECVVLLRSRRDRVALDACVEIKIYGAFVLNRRVVLHAIDATPARWRGDAGSSPRTRRSG